jgi:hypothetical protein
MLTGPEQAAGLPLPAGRHQHLDLSQSVHGDPQGPPGTLVAEDRRDAVAAQVRPYHFSPQQSLGDRNDHITLEGAR